MDDSSFSSEPTAFVFQLNSSNGGVPKRGRHTVTVGELGITIDRQNDRQHHGGPDRALCLYSLERILALQREGHAIFPGSVGENITTVGLPDRFLRPGVRLQLGPEVLIVLTTHAVPCQTIRDSFKEGEFRRISHEKNPGWSRMYARVIAGGRLDVGDPIIVVKEPNKSD